jgi:hypothetical protein
MCVLTYCITRNKTNSHSNTRARLCRGLVDYKGQQQAEKRRSKPERELVGRLRMFARFHTHEEHEVRLRVCVCMCDFASSR